VPAVTDDDPAWRLPHAPGRDARVRLQRDAGPVAARAAGAARG
jgi:hypothetical protein